jgi:glycosyltransferase XagB
MRGLAAGRERASVDARVSAQYQRFSRTGKQRPPERDHELPVELAAFAGLLDPALLEAAARRAKRLGVGVDEVLRCHGLLAPDLITQAIAEHLGLPIDPLIRAREPVSLAAACAGVLARNEPGWSRSITVAPRSVGIRQLAAVIKQDPRLAHCLRIASPERFNQHVRTTGAQALAQEAVYGLQWRWPDLSAATKGRRRMHTAALVCLAFLGAVITTPATLFVAIEYFLALSFSLWTALRFTACMVHPDPIPRIEIPDRFLPIYTLIIPLYREAAVFPRLIAALKRLDYPPEKLDIKIVLEEDDRETREIAERLALTAPFEIVVLPKFDPQAKPKALAAVLPFARGSYVAVYDAEDEPDPRQLRDALAAFKIDPELVCVQAKLTIDNAFDGWLSRHFAAEYAGLFEVFLPALAKFGLPLPLGGTSNHFRTDVLRAVGGWDPFNVTEDADLGMRFARFGYRTGTFDSLTWEEAPVGCQQWLRQRSRWFKGWMQTWLVHMRHPIRLWRELGWSGFIALQLIAGGSVLAALAHPVLLAVAIHDLLGGVLIAEDRSADAQVRNWLAFAVLTSGYASSICIGLVGLKRRGLLRVGWTLLTIPAYWLLLSAAAARAVCQLLQGDHGWEKTPHGLGRSSLRRATQADSSDVRPMARDFTAAIARKRGRR